ncbi:MAG TPA: glycerophosphodiester phosphodiesterase [Longimicrobiaceae bacterium]|nr:glycerophosphodiester phosphodiesterase [Longimicrobiaceae bacterium]
MRLPRLPVRGGSRPGHRYLAGAPLLIAHRGGSALAPENTLLAFRRALEWWGADLLEIDVQPTRDGEAVVIHDETVDRTTDGSGPVSAFTVDELRRLDAGHRFTPDGGATFPCRGGAARLSTLREVLAALPRARVNVEIKDGRAQPAVWDTIHEAGAQHRVLVAAGKRANRSRFGAYAGPTSASGEELYAFYLHHLLHATPLHAPGVDAFQLPERHGGRRVLSPRLVREAHARNVAVHVWTVDEESDMRRLLGWEVDGIITDRPDRLARVLHAHAGRPLPPGPPAGEVEPWLERLLRA